MSNNNGKVYGITFGIIPEKLMHNPLISDGAVRLYAHMHWRYGLNQRNWESRQSIVELLGVSKHTLTQRIRELEYHNWIAVQERVGTTPFYHVFTSQDECEKFRLDNFDIVRMKSPVEPPKKRTGDNLIKARQAKKKSNPSSHVDDHPSIRLDDHPSSHVDAIQTHSIQTQVSLPDDKSSVTRSTASGVVSPHHDLKESHEDESGSVDNVKVKKPRKVKESAPKQPREKNPAIEAVSELWELPFVRAGQILKFLLGQYTEAKKGTSEWVAHNPEIPLTPDDIRPFVAWYKRQNKGFILPSKPETLASWVYRYVTRVKQPTAQTPTYTPPLPNPDDIWG